MNRVFARLTRFKNQLIILWYAFLDKRTPLYLKLVMIAVAAYIISPIDFLPDVFAVVGWIDDAILLAFAVDWIISRLPNYSADTHPMHKPSPDAAYVSEKKRVIDRNARHR